MEMGSWLTKALGLVTPNSHPTSAARVLPKELQLSDYSVIVAGGTSGMGLEVSKALCSKGAYVAILGHNMAKGQAALAQIKAAIGPSAKTDFFLVDLTSLNAIKTFVSAWKVLGHPLHSLVCIAGTLLTPYEKTEDGFECTVASNYLGHFYLAHLLLDELKGAAPSRFVWMTSVYEQLGSVPWGDIGGQLARDSDLAAYCNANLMALMAARSMAKHLQTSTAPGSHGIDIFSVQPGLVNSPLYNKVNWSKPLGLAHIATARLFGQDPGWGAGSATYAAAHPLLDGHGWAYFGPPYFFPLASFLPHTANLTPRNPAARNLDACDALYKETVQLLESVTGEELPNKLLPLEQGQVAGPGPALAAAEAKPVEAKAAPPAAAAESTGGMHKGAEISGAALAGRGLQHEEGVVHTLRKALDEEGIHVIPKSTPGYTRKEERDAKIQPASK